MDGFAGRLEMVRGRVAAACSRSGRDPAAVRVLPVAKTFGPEAVREAADAGCDLIGENRVQEARQKIPLCPGRLRWHMIGHLQTNKVGLAVELFEMIHSVDSLKLLRAVDAACAEAGRVMPVCLEVNVSGEGSKYGLGPESVPEVLEAAGGLAAVDVVGLMTIPPFTPDPADARTHFRRLRELRDGWREATGFPLEELSMGMSHDFEVAVEEGATWVRIGSALFGSRRGA